MYSTIREMLYSIPENESEICDSSYSMRITRSKYYGRPIVSSENYNNRERGLNHAVWDEILQNVLVIYSCKVCLCFEL